MQVFIGLISLIVAVHAANAADAPGSGDHPLVPRYPDSEICAFEAREFDEYRLVVGPAISRDEIPTKTLDGRTLRNMYVLKDEQRSPLEVMRNYEIALKDAGFTEVYRCAGDGCSEGAAYTTFFFFRANPNLHLSCRVPDLANWGMPEQEPRYFAARLLRPGEPETHVAITVAAWALRGGGGPRYVFVQADVVEAESMRVGMQLKLAGDIDKDIRELGHAAIYGIHFATDSADIEPSSAASLEEIAKYLEANLEIRLLVVGHTDDRGTLTYNLNLSEQRARAVVQHLVDRHGIAEERLDGHGVGYLAPIASNETEEGRASNRRVELVRSPASGS
jgi:OmpA-OmpF porin, OOP family